MEKLISGLKAAANSPQTPIWRITTCFGESAVLAAAKSQRLTIDLHDEMKLVPESLIKESARRSDLKWWVVGGTVLYSQREMVTVEKPVELSSLEALSKFGLDLLCESVEYGSASPAEIPALPTIDLAEPREGHLSIDDFLVKVESRPSLLDKLKEMLKLLMPQAPVKRKYKVTGLRGGKEILIKKKISTPLEGLKIHHRPVKVGVELSPHIERKLVFLTSAEAKKYRELLKAAGLNRYSIHEIAKAKAFIDFTMEAQAVSLDDQDLQSKAPPL